MVTQTAASSTASGWLLERADRVAILVRNDPPMNLTTLGSTAALYDHLRNLTQDKDVRAVVVTAAGDRFFGAGSNLQEFAAFPSPKTMTVRKMEPEHEVFTLLEKLPVPTIAALNGTALGGALELALCCDFIIAERGREVGLPEINLGLFPGGGGPVRAARRAGASRAKRLVLTGDPISVETAVACGTCQPLRGS